MGAPLWMESTHEIWFRDPQLLFKGMLENPKFQDFFDYVPLQQYDAHGGRWWIADRESAWEFEMEGLDGGVIMGRQIGSC